MGSSNFRSLIALSFVGLVWSQLAEARPEYAADLRVSCTACHVSPFGGGPRNVDGRMYGSRFAWPSELSKQSWLSADIRGISYYPKGGTQSRQGTALMTSTVAANVPVKTYESGSEIRAVGAFSFGVVYQGPREIYVMWQSAPTKERPTMAQFGRFNAPFGLLTDEHRTYTRLLTRTEIFDYENGASLSGDPVESLHYDFAVTNGLQSGGQFNQNSPTQEDATSAGFVNLRWSPASAPLFLGVSAEYHDRASSHPDPYAFSAYGVLSLGRLTGHHLEGSLLAEAVYAGYWADADLNPNINRYFVPQSDAAFVNAIRGVPALATSTQLNVNITKAWVAQYKLDNLVFDPQYMGDRYLRHGVGAKYYFDSNIILMARYEFADVGREEFKNASVFAAQDAFWAMFQIWL